VLLSSLMPLHVSLPPYGSAIIKLMWKKCE